MFLIGGDEDYQRRLDLHHTLDHAEPVEPGHLDVEEDQIGLFRLDLADRLAPVGAGVDDFHIGKFLETERQPLDGELFIIDEDGANGHARFLIQPAPNVPARAGRFGAWDAVTASRRSNGISIRTANPPSGGSIVSKRWSAP